MADWYTGWVGKKGSRHHRRHALPALLELLEPRPGERILDIGCGPGVPAPSIAAAGADYTGVDVSRRLIAFARRNQRSHGRFIVGDATRLQAIRGLERRSFDAAFFLLSIQDIAPLEPALDGTADLVRPGGRIVIVMMHPCFRIPRQSGWGWDDGRRLRFRRVDRYLTPIDVPMKRYDGGRRATRSHHRPLHVYVNGLARNGCAVDRIMELPGDVLPPSPHATKAERHAARRAAAEIPLMLGLRAVRLSGGVELRDDP